MKRLSYYLIAAFFAFIVGVCGVIFLLYLDNSSPIEESITVSEHSDINQSQNDNFPVNSKESVPLPCSRSGADPSKPWEHISKVLDSFPPDNPLPKFVGTFRDRNWNYQLDLYRDSNGIFGEISSPVLEADSPTSRLYMPVFDSTNGSLKFSASFSDGTLDFSGFLHSKILKGKFTQNGHTETVSLNKLKERDEYLYKSRSEFNCAMTLFGRY